MGASTSESTRGSDVFPHTQNTWIDRQLGLGEMGMREINRHLMSVYAFPLRVYFLGSSALWLGEPDDVVNGFFADRLSREDFVAKWKASGMRLRRWLMNAFCYYLMEIRKLRKRNSAAGELPENLPDEPITFSGNPDEAVDRAFVVSLVRRAMETAGTRCAEEGLGEHWAVFVRHHMSEHSYAKIAPDFSVTAARAAVMARTAGRKFRESLRELLTADGASPERVDQEIAALLEIADHE
jgi:hypothetical protein